MFLAHSHGIDFLPDDAVAADAKSIGTIRSPFCHTTKL
jgi:hypothetical protein